MKVRILRRFMSEKAAAQSSAAAFSEQYHHSTSLSPFTSHARSASAARGSSE